VRSARRVPPAPASPCAAPHSPAPSVRRDPRLLRYCFTPPPRGHGTPAWPALVKKGLPPLGDGRPQFCGTLALASVGGAHHESGSLARPAGPGRATAHAPPSSKAPGCWGGMLRSPKPSRRPSRPAATACGTPRTTCCAGTSRSDPDRRGINARSARFRLGADRQASRHVRRAPTPARGGRPAGQAAFRRSRGAAGCSAATMKAAARAMAISSPAPASRKSTGRAEAQRILQRSRTMPCMRTALCLPT